MEADEPDDAEDLYSPEADEQLDGLEATAPVDLYNEILACIKHILDTPETARRKAPPLQDAEGRAVLSTVVMYDKDPRWFVFWRIGPSGPVILGIGPLPDLPGLR